MSERRPFKQTTPLDQRLTEDAQRLRKEAQGSPSGFAREQLIRQARQAETAAHMHGGLHPRACKRRNNRLLRLHHWRRRSHPKA